MKYKFLFFILASVPLFGDSLNCRGVVWGLFYLNNLLYIADGQAGLEIWGVPNSNSLSKLGSYNTAGEAFGLYVSDSYAYATDDVAGLQIYQNPASFYFTIRLPQTTGHMMFQETTELIRTFSSWEPKIFLPESSF